MRWSPPAEERPGVAAGGLGERGTQIDGEGAFRHDAESGAGEARAPVGAQLRHPLGVLLGLYGVTAGFQAGPPSADVVGEEAREARHLDHGQETAGAQPLEDLAQATVGVGEVVDGGRRPHQVHGAEVRPCVVQIRLDGSDAVRHSVCAGFAPQTLQEVGGSVDGDRLGVLEALEQGEGAGAGAAAQVEDAAGWVVPRQLGQLRRDVGQIGVQDFGVEVQEFGPGRVVRPGGAVLVVVLVVVVRHVSSVSGACLSDIPSRV